MKFALNGALTIGTLDGANIEIREEVGADNFFLFGLTVPQVREMAARGPYRPRDYYDRSPAIRQIMDAFQSNLFCPNAPGQHAWVGQKLLAENEKYLHLADLESYLAAHTAAGRLYENRSAWATAAILNVARVGKFSSDRTIREYAREIWKIESVV
jgi:starch phosphorylase